MITYLFLTIVLVFAFRSFTSWRKGIVLMIILAALQDPLRKLAPGTPGWMTLGTVPVFIALVLASAVTTKGWWIRFGRAHGSVARLMILFALMCLPPIALSASYGPGSWKITVVGVVSYAIMLSSVIAGFHLARNSDDVRKVLVTYSLVHGVMMLGALMETSGRFDGLSVLGSDALGYEWVRHEPGYVVEMIAGFYRSADVMGWHASAVACFAILLAFASSGKQRMLWIVVLLLAMAALLLCGRRKMVFMLPVFLGALYWLYLSAGRAAKATALVFLLLIPAGGVVVLTNWLGEDATQLRYYRDTSDRNLDHFEAQSLKSVISTVQQSGIFGEGLGFATPGSHHIVAERPRTWQESAPSRVVVELGVPGALAFLALLVAVAKGMLRVARKQIEARGREGVYSAALVAFFIANVSSLTVSGQILADPFISAFLGILVGVVLGYKRLDIAANTPAAPPIPAWTPKGGSYATPP